MNAWIKRSEREPAPSDLPIAAAAFIGGEWHESYWNLWSQVNSCPFSHWRSIKCDPPARELTQRERDEAEARELAERCGAYHRKGLILEAIYAERREMTRLMDGLWPEGKWGRGDSYNSQCKAIRARLDEQGAK